MATAPKFDGPDGVQREHFSFSTSSSHRFFTGSMDSETVDMQVSVRGAAFTSNPDLVAFEGDSFIIPNPSAFPDGLQLLAGSNTILVKSIVTTGETSATASIDARLSQERDLGTVLHPPSSVRLERLNRTVRLSIEGLDDSNVVGYHFYASVEPGGGFTGYSRINPTMVVAGVMEESTSLLGELEVEAVVQTNADGTHAADPLYVVLTGTQQNGSGTILSTDMNEALEVPETVEQVRTTVTIESVVQKTRYSFTHSREATFSSAQNAAIPNAAFNTIPESDPLYYVVTAVYLVNGKEYESEFSLEVSGAPLTVTPNVGSLPTVSHQQIVQDMSLAMFRAQPQLDISPGSVTRDTVINPFATEAERIRFLIDFLHVAQSFTTLLQIDDPNLSGSSIPVAQSEYKLALKSALYLPSTDAVQALIDSLFDKLAANYGVVRRGGRRARGEVVFYTTRRPLASILIPIGTIVSGGGVRFRTTSVAQINANGSGAFFDPKTGRYSARAFVQAEEPGRRGNLGRNQVRTVVNGPSGVQVFNPADMFGGMPEDSNRDLATQAQNAFVSADSGRLHGYIKTVTDISNIDQVSVITADHLLMQRDYEPTLGKHTGGKVDIWIRGQADVPARVSDTFAFSFEIAKDVQFEIVGAVNDLKFRALDNRLSAESPLVELLDFTDFGYTFRNTSRGYDFVLTDAEILDHNTIQLSSVHNDPADLAITDVFKGSYRYRTSNHFVFSRQPASQIRSFEGTRTGVVSPAIYDLFQPSSPLQLGRSVLAGTYVQVVDPLESGVVVPSTELITVEGEEHVLLDGIEYLNNLGANPLTVRVFNLDRTEEYNGPYVSGVTPDFLITNGTETVPLAIRINPNGSDLSEGDVVLVDYQHDENFIVTYETDSLVAVAQDVVNQMKHITADVLVKSAVAVGVDITATIILQQGISKAMVDPAVRTALSNLFRSLTLGQPIRQSDVVETIKRVPGVSYVVVPLTKMVKQDGAPVVQEFLPTSIIGTEYLKVEAWSTNSTSTWLILTQLESATIDGGGPLNDYRGVFLGETALNLQMQSPNVSGVPLKNSSRNAFIIGSDGMSIPGYNDDATLRAEQPFATDEQLRTQRINLSSNRVLLTLPTAESPGDYDVSVAYTVQGETGVKNIEPGPVEYLVVGEFFFAYDEEQSYSTRISRRRSGSRG